MSRKKCNRRVWRRVNPIEHAIQGVAVTDKARLDKLRLLELSALEAFRTGKAKPDDWRALADMNNVAQIMAEKMGIGPEVLPACEAAEQALGAAHQRYVGKGRLGFTGPELQALRDLAEFHDLQRTSISRSDYERAIKMTGDRIRSQHPDVKVFMSEAPGEPSIAAT